LSNSSVSDFASKEIGNCHDQKKNRGTRVDLIVFNVKGGESLGIIVVVIVHSMGVCGDLLRV